jgi:hypothetical protein
MKPLFIFLLFSMLGLGCTQQQSLNRDNPTQILSAEAEEWRATIPGYEEFTEHGTDLTIELNHQFTGVQFLHVIYNGRKSYLPAVQTTENKTTIVQARVIYSSEILSETSDKSNQADRIVFQTEEGNIDFIPIPSWTKRPLSYR